VRLATVACSPTLDARCPDHYSPHRELSVRQVTQGWLQVSTQLLQQQAVLRFKRIVGACAVDGG
jgi:hypothetical protein